jgi:hypothetical protein
LSSLSLLARFGFRQHARGVALVHDHLSRRKTPRLVKPHEAFYYPFGGNYAAKRMLGEPTTPLFSKTAFISFEPNHVRAFDMSATSARITTSFWSSALRNTLLFVIPAVSRSFLCLL